MTALPVLTSETLTHQTARLWALEVCDGHDAARANAARGLAAIAHLESRYGAYAYQVPVELLGVPRGPTRFYGTTRPACVGRPIPGALGAVQAGASWTGGCQWALDSSPQDDGTTRWYATPYRAFTAWREAWESFRTTAYDVRPTVLRAAEVADWPGVSAALRATRYYEGFGATQEIRISRHLNALCLGLYEADVAHGIGRCPTLRVGSKGPAVVQWQKIVGATPDGSFGPLTQAATARWQTARSLDVGAVGPRTWSRALYGGR